MGTATLEWDSAGNLVRRGDQRYQYDYRNRLTLVTDLAGLEEIARYEYDAFNRRLKKTVGSVVTETVWDGWEPVEEYRDGQLQSRRLFGLELGELVRLEQDLDGNGTLEQTYLPVFDSLGHLAELRREDGSLVERYTYTPFGERRVFLPDTEPPRIEQVLAMPLEIRLEVSEEVDLAKLHDALDTGISLRSQVTGLFFDVTISQPPTDGCKPGRRLVLRKASTNPEDPWPEPNEPVELYFAADLLNDRAGNTQPAALSKIFPWPTQPVVIQDDVAPRVTTLGVEPAGTVLITFSEPPSLARLASVAKINGAVVTWTPLPEGYSVRSPRLAEGSYALTLSTADLDLADLGLIEPYALNFEVDGERHILKEEPPPGQVAASTAGNGIGFHGLGMDEETGLLYARNRYYDPEMGRFVTMDPLGYVDGPNGYQYAGNDPANGRDPLGLQRESCSFGLPEKAAELCRQQESRQAEVVFSALANPYVAGSLQILGGCSLAVIGATATAGTAGLAAVPGIAAVGYGLDQCWTGVLTIATGEIQTTLVYKGLNAGYGTFLSPEQAQAAALWTDMAIGTGLGVGVGRVVVVPAGNLSQVNRLAPEGAEHLAGVPREAGVARGWRVGDPITNLTARGKVPAWSTVRARFWKNEALSNPATYSAENLTRMRRGLAPQQTNPVTGVLESMELHHAPSMREGGLFEVTPVWPSEHAAIDPFRHVGN